MRAFIQLAAILAASGLIQAQTLDLFTFEEVRAALERGGSVVLDVDGSQCDSNFPYPDGEHRYISLPFRNWVYVNDGAGNEYISANDYYVQVSDPETFPMGITARQAEVRSDNTVSFHFRAAIPANNESFAVDLECVLGRSGRVFEAVLNPVIDTYRTYREVKGALLLGKHVDAIMFGEACEATEGWIAPGEAVHYGHRIEDFSFYNEGTPDEVAVFHVSYLAPSGDEAGQQFVWNSVAWVLSLDETVTVTAATFQPPDFTTNLWPYPASICQTGISLQFSSYREKEASYVTYDEVKEATLMGHEMEVIVFTEFCDVVSGITPQASVSGIRFDQFQLFKAGEIWGPDEHITYGNFFVSPDGTTSLNEVRLYPNERILFDWARWTADGVSSKGQISCPLQISALFHAVSSDRGPTFSYVQIMRAIKNEGAIFEIEINYDGCERGGSPVELDSIYGAVLWETYIRENELGIDTEFVAPVFTAQIDNVTGNGGLLWSVGIIIVYPNNEVLIYPRAYDWQTNDVTPFPTADPIVCKLNTGGLDGSVYFFRYP